MIHIPIVMATDNNFEPLVVSLTSLAENAENDTFYDIYILVDSTFTQDSEVAVKRYLEKYTRQCSLSFKNVGVIFDNALISIPHITCPTFFRLAAPDLLNEDKCIYLDTDTIVMSDLKALFDTPLDDSYVAGVWHPGVVLFDWESVICKNAHVPNASQYINAGVLVMNLKELRRNNVVKSFLELISQNMPSQDQDIINHVCYGKIAFIPLKYNVITKLADRCFEDYKGSYSEAELKEAWNKPCIIHYADRYKPWNSEDCTFMEQWWNFCRRSSMYECIVSDFLGEFINNVLYHSHRDLFFTKKMPKLFDIAFERKYVIYGAGKRSSEVISFLKRLRIIPEFIIVSSLKENPSEVDGIEVRDINEVRQLLHDKSIIIAVRESLHKTIIKKLQECDCLELFPLSDDFKEGIR